MHIYTLKAESPAALAAMLDAAQAGKARPFVTWEGGAPVYDGARIVYPVPEMVAGEPVADPETGDPVTPFEPTGLWFCEVRLREADAELAAMVEA